MSTTLEQPRATRDTAAASRSSSTATFGTRLLRDPSHGLWTECSLMQGFQLLSMVRRVLRRGWLTDGLERCDARLLAAFPPLQRFCRYAVLTLRR